MPGMLDLALLLAFPAAMAFAAAMDLLTMTIPNRVSIALAAAFLAVAPFSGLGWEGIASHIAAGLLMLGLGILMFTRGWVGGGDAKLLSAAALWMGFENLGSYLLMVAVCGGVLAILVFSYRGVLLPSWLCRQAWALRLHDKTTGIPYGIAIAAGALWIYPKTIWFTGLSS